MLSNDSKNETYGGQVHLQYDRENNELHLSGNGEVAGITDTCCIPREVPFSTGCYNYDDDGNCIDCVTVDEGITAFQDDVLAKELRLHAKKLVLPSTLMRMPTIGMLVDTLVVPPTITQPIGLMSMLFYDCNGHFDPITYAVRSLHLPSTVVIDDDEMEAFSETEPVDFLEEIVLYGEQPLSDDRLNALVSANVFAVDIRVRYPKNWDEGADVTFAACILECVQKRKPMKLVDFSMQDATDWEYWTEDDFRQLRERIETY